MDPPPPPPSSTPQPTSPSNASPPLPPSATKIRLMCSYGGHIVPRPHDKSLFYAGGETRIVALDRGTTAASLSVLTAHLSRTLFGNRPFLLKYLLPSEELDSLISVSTDDDLLNMLEEHDRINSYSQTNARIRLFLFPVKPESIGSALLDPKSESWFCDALKNTMILQKGHSADSGLIAGTGAVGGSDLDSQLENGSNGGGAVDVGKHGPESVVLETSSSFGSTSSSISMSNLPPIGMYSEDYFPERKIRVPSSSSIESDYSIGSTGCLSKAGVYQEPLIEVASRASSYSVDPENTLIDHSVNQLPKNLQFQGYHFAPQPNGKQLQNEAQYIHGGTRYIPQYPTGTTMLSSHYPVYQMPMHQSQPQHVPYPVNSPYPVYLVPVRPAQYHNMSMQGNFADTVTGSLGRPPLHPLTPVITHPVAQKERDATQPMTEPATSMYTTVAAVTPQASVPCSQGQQQITGPPEMQSISVTVTTASAAAVQFDNDISYSQIYKSQPPAPALSSQYQSMMKGTDVLFSEPSMQFQPNNIKQQPA